MLSLFLVKILQLQTLGIRRGTRSSPGALFSPILKSAFLTSSIEISWFNSGTIVNGVAYRNYFGKDGAFNNYSK